MTSGQAKRTTVVALIAAGGLAAVRDFAGGHVPRIRIVFGVFIAAVILAGMAEFAPQLAGAFAVLILITAIAVVGGDAWGALNPSKLEANVAGTAAVAAGSAALGAGAAQAAGSPSSPNPSSPGHQGPGSRPT